MSNSNHEENILHNPTTYVYIAMIVFLMIWLYRILCMKQDILPNNPINDIGEHDALVFEMMGIIPRRVDYDQAVADLVDNVINRNLFVLNRNGNEENNPVPQPVDRRVNLQKRRYG